ncbi:MAG: hypothetical protein ABR509_05925 [Candidatus Limnocylindria bacterium]
MTFIPTPNRIDARVTWDARRDRPATVVAAGRRLSVTRLIARREELAAFPATRGPRVTYLVTTNAGDVRLVFDVRRRAWHVEAAPLAVAA